ncbi:mannose-1-phosphate guanylyltransferase/mannose-6-phosphate isomerase [Enterobacteriaceae bacterium YMB-R22]|uniref:mannose-1-phosphate guanylyltransferase/mannose-6-phosphate isomerase n=1 Tax=Tenebrionicola larvae TaxID=2815733 RepID=UPI002012BA4F|nr:mannose-1-phosphate guanylyltransferase/mannose-6-phosphate isomerase [Tenebrionicola larvae]MBV4412039.1 mannose-1-phosphate guanylyltransferase/mannose-6-phosphate isomerase [Tenebrionicola larvae]
MLDTVTAVILAGGVGSRLWPLSREQHPKQFISVEQGITLLEGTLNRLPDIGINKVVIVCNHEHRFLVAEELRKKNLLNENIVLEPLGKNTAAAVALAAIDIKNKTGEEQKLLVLAADHIIKDIDSFKKAVSAGVDASEDNKLITFGVIPTYPETGYGYIQKGELKKTAVYNVKRFVEKPCIELAEEYLLSGAYLWNSGMFLFKAKVFLDELNKFRPDIFASCCAAIDTAQIDENFIRIDRQVFSSCPSESIDYAVMENSANTVVVPLDSGWSDVGSWHSIWDISTKDDSGNCLIGDIIAFNVSNSYIRSENKLVAVTDVNNIIVVETEDSVLITNKDKSQNVKHIVEMLKVQKRNEHIQIKKQMRYWGTVFAIDDTGDHKINKLCITPGKYISYQYHEHRVESWYILSGLARIVIDGHESVLKASESVLIPPKSSHMVENISQDEALIIIEIQHGNSIDEHDINRI